jgi:hypothetical protein
MLDQGIEVAQTMARLQEPSNGRLGGAQAPSLQFGNPRTLCSRVLCKRTQLGSFGSGRVRRLGVVVTEKRREKEWRFLGGLRGFLGSVAFLQMKLVRPPTVLREGIISTYPDRV